MLYLSYPIDFVTPEQIETVEGWVSAVKAESRTQGWVVFDPHGAFWTEDRTFDRALMDLSYDAIRRSQAVLALLPDGVQSIGVPMEIQYALDLGRYVAVVGGASSWALAGSAAFRAKTIAEAVKWLSGGHVRPSCRTCGRPNGG